MTREDLDFIGSMNLCDEISNEAYKKIVCHCEEQEPCEDAIDRQAPCDDCISRVDALRVAKNEYLRGWHNALCKALSEKYSIHCEEGNFSVIQEETIKGLGLSMNSALSKDVESYMSTIPRVAPKEPILDKIRAELHSTAEMHEDGDYYLRDEWIDEYFDKYKAESEDKE